MKACILTLACVAAVFVALPAQAQFADAPSKGPKLDKPVTQKWRTGVVINAIGGTCVGLYATIPVPTDWPEQQVRIVDEDITNSVRQVGYRTLDGGVKQMLISIPQLVPGQEAHALVTFEVITSPQLPPDDTSSLVIPSRVPRGMAAYVGSSPYIDCRNAKIREQARDIVADKPGAWQQVEAIYDWVRNNIESQNQELSGAVDTLKNRQGDSEDLVSLFIALCRANKIPARTVWVHGHFYAEFYLQDGEGNGYWYPCQLVGTRDFGGMSDHRPILQKGDNIKVPEKPDRQRFVAEYLKGKAGGGKPEVNFIRDLLPAN